MSQKEKIVAILLGVLVFAGLFVSIYSAMKAPPPAPAMGDYDFGRDLGGEAFDFDVEPGTAPLEGLAPDAEPPAAPAEKAKP